MNSPPQLTLKTNRTEPLDKGRQNRRECELAMGINILQPVHERTMLRFNNNFKEESWKETGF